MPTQLRTHNPLKGSKVKTWVPPETANAKAFYNGARWQKVRAIKLKQQPLCLHCEEEGNPPTIATVVDHIVDRRVRPDLAYDLNNLEGLCESHHNRKTARRKGPQQPGKKPSGNPAHR